MSKILSVTDATNACIGFTRPIREGEQVLNANFVISVGVKNKEDSVLHIQALVLRTSGVSTQHPYLVELWVDLRKDYGSRVIRDKSVECECKAGESQKCKHIIAVMLYLARAEEDGLEDLTCTDIEQQWGSLKVSTLAEYQAKLTSELCHVNDPKLGHVAATPKITSEMKETWKNILVTSNPCGELQMFFCGIRKGAGLVDVPNKEQIKYNSAIITKILTSHSWMVMGRLHNLTVLKVQSLSTDLRIFYEGQVKVSIDQSIAIAGMIQGTQEWTSYRKKILTASKARSQYTYLLNPRANWDKRYDELYHSTFKGNEDTIRGLRCEGLAREAYEDCTAGRKIFECGLLVRPELPWLGASLDGIVLNGEGKIFKTIEIKTVKEGTRLSAQELKEMKAVKSLDSDGQLKKTTDHYGQVQIGMLLSGVPECDYIVYSEKGNDIVKVPVPFDPVYVLDLVSRLSDVYFDKFLPRIKLDFSN